MSYCTLTDLKTYLNITTSTDDALLQLMLDAATARIDSDCARTFAAPTDSTRYFDPSIDVIDGELWPDDDLSYITSVINGDSNTTNVTSSLYTMPRNNTPYYALGFKTSSSYTWEYTTDAQNAISITGRFAYLHKVKFTAISRSSNVVTVTTERAANIPVGGTLYVVGVADTSFNGTFTSTASSATAVSWAQTASNDTDTTGYLLYTPSDIVTACRRLAAWMYRQKDTQQGDLDRPLLAGDGTVIMPTTLPNDVSYLLIPYIKTL